MFTRNEIVNADAVPTRVHYPWYELEEYRPDGGMWSTAPALKRQHFINLTSELMANPAKFAESMRQALKDWPKSVAVALTTPGMNHRAWLGHAGCYLATGSPEETTRLGWHELDDAEQWAANAAANQVIAEWRKQQQPDDVQMRLFNA